MIGLLSSIRTAADGSNDDVRLLMDLYSRHYKLWQYQVRQLVPDDEADDIIHDVFLDMVSAHLDFLRTLSEAKQVSYIARSLETAARKRNAERAGMAACESEEAVADDGAGDPAEIIDRQAGFAVFRRALDRLPPDKRDLIYYKFFEELPDNEIAALLEIKPASLRSALTRARRALKKEMERGERDE